MPGDNPNLVDDTNPQGAEAAGQVPAVSPEEEARRTKRKEEADAVADLLKEAFGSTAVAEAKKPPPKPEEISVAQALKVQEEQHLWASGLFEKEALETPADEHLLRKLLQNAGGMLEKIGVSPTVLPVYLSITLLLIIFQVQSPIWLGALGIMVLFSAFGVRPINLLGIMSILVFTMEIADVFRQWSRIRVILGL